jgi:hypothetical protein
MRGTFTGPAESTYSHDQGKAAFYREQEQQRRERELTERVAGAIAGGLGGREFTTLVELHLAAHAWVQSQRDMTSEIELATARAAVLLWLGKHDRDSRYRRCVEKVGNVIRFVA